MAQSKRCLYCDAELPLKSQFTAEEQASLGRESADLEDYQFERKLQDLRAQIEAASAVPPVQCLPGL
jgi:hypothetical protein